MSIDPKALEAARRIEKGFAAGMNYQEPLSMCDDALLVARALLAGEGPVYDYERGKAISPAERDVPRADIHCAVNNDDIVIRLRRAYDETGNALLGDALAEISRLRAVAADDVPESKLASTARPEGTPPPPVAEPDAPKEEK